MFLLGLGVRERGLGGVSGGGPVDEFVRALLSRSDLKACGRPVGSTPLRVRTVFFKAVMFLLHCYPHIVLLLTRVSFLSPLSS